MLLRARGFGEAHRALFPESTDGAAALAVVTEAIADVETNLQVKLLASKEGRQAKVAARALVKRALRAVARTARRVARTEAGDENKLQFPKRRSDVALVNAGKTFVTEVQGDPARFIRLNLPPTFVDDLKHALSVLEEATDDRAEGLRQARAAQSTIVKALARGIDATNTLDVCIANVAEDDPAVYGVWKRERRIVGETRPRVKKASGSKTSTPNPFADSITQAS